MAPTTLKTLQRRDDAEIKMLAVTLVEHASPIPIYVQIEQDLRRLSRTGSAIKVPAETELAAMYGVSRVSIRQALARLAAAGLVKREHGRGTTLLPRPDVGLDLSLFRSVTDQLRESGHKGKVKMLQRALKQVPEDVANALQLKPHDKGVLLKRLVLVNDVPLSINTSWFPAALVPGLQKLQIEDSSVWATLADRYGIMITSTKNAIEVLESGVSEAEELQVDYGTPLIRLATCFSDKQDRPVEYSVSIWRPANLRINFAQHL